MFCQKLLMCINTPTTVDELQSDYMELPLLIQNDVMSQRHIQLVPRLYQQIFEGKPMALPEVDKDKILPVERLAIGAKGFLMVITTVFFWGELHLRLYFLVCLCAIDLLGSGGARGLTKLRYFEKRKWKPYGKYNKAFNEFIDRIVTKFYHELEGETGALLELNDWEAQPDGAPRGYIGMQGFAEDMPGPQQGKSTQKCLCMEPH
ncbi:hypothetical protein SLS64_006264 [Diaporthe eres]|uniref:Uncharacterized protein n=1 Tax=Diaporthe eres TaxID=83184 RepID=A0ABR1NW54_DIAER